MLIILFLYMNNVSVGILNMRNKLANQEKNKIRRNYPTWQNNKKWTKTNDEINSKLFLSKL